MKQSHLFSIKNQYGVVAIVAAIAMTVLIGIAALAIDIGYVFATKNELQNIADSAALAGTRELGAIYETMSYEQQQSYVCDPTSITNIVQEVAGKNQAAGISITIDEVKIGCWDTVTRSFSESLSQPDAVWVTAVCKDRREEGGDDESISTFFAKIFNIDSVEVEADAIAALTGQSTAGEGEIELPVGLSRSRFDVEGNGSGGDGSGGDGSGGDGNGGDYPWCGDKIAFAPTTDPDACSGWTNFKDGNNVDDPEVQNILDGITKSPEIRAEETYFNFTNGKLSSPTFESMLTLFQYNGYDVDAEGNPRIDTDGNALPPGESAPNAGPAVALYDNKGDPLKYPDGKPQYDHRWKTTVLVYDSDTCTPNKRLEILGFAEVELYDVRNSPEKTILARIKCDYVDLGRGGGANFGVKGSIPGLVR